MKEPKIGGSDCRQRRGYQRERLRSLEGWGRRSGLGPGDSNGTGFESWANLIQTQMWVSL